MASKYVFSKVVRTIKQIDKSTAIVGNFVTLNFNNWRRQKLGMICTTGTTQITQVEHIILPLQNKRLFKHVWSSYKTWPYVSHKWNKLQNIQKIELIQTGISDHNAIRLELKSKSLTRRLPGLEIRKYTC